MDEQMQYTPERLDAMELLSQAKLLAESGRLDAAHERLDAAEKADPMYLQVYLDQGTYYINVDDYGQAKKCYEKALLLDKENGEVYFHLANVELLMDNYSEAIITYGKAESLGYQNPVLPENMAFCYEQTDQPDAALTAYMRAIRMTPDNPSPRLRRIQLLVKQGSMEAAQTAAEDFVQRFPDLREGYELLVDLLIARDDLEEAEKRLEAALETYPDAPVLLIQLARVAALQNRPERVMELLEKVRASKDADEETLALADEYEAHLKLMQEDMDGALAVYQRIIDKEPEGETEVEARMSQMLLLNGAKRYDELLQAALSAQKTPECDGMLCIAYAMEPLALENLGRVAEARERYEAANRKLRLLGIQDTSHTDTYMYRAMCYRGLGQYDEALKQLGFYEDLGIQVAPLYELKAKIYEDMGDTAKAAEARAEAERRKQAAQQ